jgi:tetratricopeptide (TPR) repeat protein
VGDLGEAAACLHSLSLTLDDLSDDVPATEAAEEAVRLSRQAGDRRQEAISLRRLGIIHMNKWDYEQALPLVEEALALHQALGDRLEECHALNVLARIHAYSSGYEQAESYSVQSIELAEALDSGLAKWNAVGNYLFVLMAQGHYQQTLTMLDQYQSEAEAAGDHWILSVTMGTRTNLLADLGDFEAALQVATALGPLVERYFEAAVEFNRLTAIGRCQAELGDFEGARLTLTGALERAEAAGLPDGTIQPHYELAYLALLRWEAGEGDRRTLEAGQQHIEKAINRLRAIDSELGLAYTLNYAAELHLALAQPGEALACMEESLRRARALQGIPVWWSRFYFTYARALAAAGRSAEGDEALARAYAEMQRVANDLQDEQLRRCWLENVRANRGIRAAWMAGPA